MLQMNRDKWQPVAYASRSMTETEQHYADRKRDFESSVWLWNCSTVMCLVYQPLQPRLTTNRSYQLERRILMTRHPEFSAWWWHCSAMTLSWFTHQENTNANALSQAPSPTSAMQVSPSTNDAKTHINMVTASLPTSDVMLQSHARNSKRPTVTESVPPHPKSLVKRSFSRFFPQCVPTCVLLMDWCWDNTGLSSHNPGYASAYPWRASWHRKNVRGEQEKQFTGWASTEILRRWYGTNGKGTVEKGKRQ